MIKAFGFLISGGNNILLFAFGVGLIICSAYVCFNLTVISINFYYLISSIAL